MELTPKARPRVLGTREICPFRVIITHSLGPGFINYCISLTLSTNPYKLWPRIFVSCKSRVRGRTSARPSSPIPSRFLVLHPFWTTFGTPRWKQSAIYLSNSERGPSERWVYASRLNVLQLKQKGRFVTVALWTRTIPHIW